MGGGGHEVSVVVAILLSVAGKDFSLCQTASLLPGRVCAHVGAGIGLELVQLLGELPQSTGAQAGASLTQGSVATVMENKQHADKTRQDKTQGTFSK